MTIITETAVACMQAWLWLRKFDLGELGTAVVEVKNGERGELVKGVYQAVKYRALMEAEKGHGESYPVKAILVAFEIPEDIAAFAEKLGVRPLSIQLSSVERYFDNGAFDMS